MPKYWRVSVFLWKWSVLIISFFFIFKISITRSSISFLSRVDWTDLLTLFIISKLFIMSSLHLFQNIKLSSSIPLLVWHVYLLTWYPSEFHVFVSSIGYQKRTNYFLVLPVAFQIDIPWRIFLEFLLSFCLTRILLSFILTYGGYLC